MGRVFFLIGVSVVLPITIVAITTYFKKFKLEVQHRERMAELELQKGKAGLSATEDKSLSINELRDMIRETVEASIKPLEQRISALEKQSPQMMPMDGYETESERRAKSMGKIAS